MFIIGSLAEPDTFTTNRFFGLEDGGRLIGIAAGFGKWGSFVAHCQQQDGINGLVDHVVLTGVKIESVPAFRRYAEPMVERLKSRHGRTPKRISEETIFLLGRRHFQPVESAATIATEADREAIARFYTASPSVSPTQKELARVKPDCTSVVHENGKVISVANVQGFSLHYAQIGGVGTLPAYRRKGYGRQCVGALCAHCFGKGVEGVILFTANTNVPAQNLYRSLGFQPIDDFLIVEYV